VTVHPVAATAAALRGRSTRLRRRPLTPLARREARWGLLFVSPWIIGFLAFTLIPMVATLGLTFTNLTLAQEEPLSFVGLDNYARLVADQR
jgi:multiple sugar transport system permease protein